MKTIILDHAQRYLDWNVADLYKLIHQASMGSEHAITDESRAQEWLHKELSTLGPGPDEPLLDPITPDGTIVRIHLRPFARLNLNPDDLLCAFIRTGQVIPPSPDKLIEYAAVAWQLAEEGLLVHKPDAITAYIQTMTECGFPAKHHSNVFVEAYSPAYRVLAHQLIPQDILASA